MGLMSRGSRGFGGPRSGGSRFSGCSCPGVGPRGWPAGSQGTEDPVVSRGASLSNLGRSTRAMAPQPGSESLRPATWMLHRPAHAISSARPLASLVPRAGRSRRAGFRPGAFPPAVENGEQLLERLRAGHVHTLGGGRVLGRHDLQQASLARGSPIAATAHEPTHCVPRVRSGPWARAPRPRWSSRAGPAAAPGRPEGTAVPAPAVRRSVSAPGPYRASAGPSRRRRR